MKKNNIYKIGTRKYRYEVEDGIERYTDIHLNININEFTEEPEEITKIEEYKIQKTTDYFILSIFKDDFETKVFFPSIVQIFEVTSDEEVKKDKNIFPYIHSFLTRQVLWFEKTEEEVLEEYPNVKKYLSNI